MSFRGLRELSSRCLLSLPLWLEAITVATRQLTRILRVNGLRCHQSTALRCVQCNSEPHVMICVGQLRSKWLMFIHYIPHLLYQHSMEHLTLHCSVIDPITKERASTLLHLFYKLCTQHVHEQVSLLPVKVIRRVFLTSSCNQCGRMTQCNFQFGDLIAPACLWHYFSKYRFSAAAWKHDDQLSCELACFFSREDYKTCWSLKSLKDMKPALSYDLNL